MSNNTKRALLIGIDAYPRLKPLQGCVNDSELMQSLLREQFGFPAENMICLRNAEATRVAILEALDRLVAATTTDDIVVIHYAGHGSQMTDREGDEPSGYDSTIMPVDSEGWQGDNRDITDDEIHLRLLQLGEKTRFITLIFDCCHSGTITRDAFGMAARSMPADTRPVSQLPPSPIPETLRQARASGASGWMPLSDRYVLIAGCRDEELSYEYQPPEAPGVKQGALTYFLARELRQAGPGTSYRDVFERAATQVNAANPRQHPQMEGSADRELFGVADIETQQFTRVTEREGANVTLALGAAMGATVGSKYAVYAQGTKRSAGAQPLGEIEITEVRATTSSARITAEASAGAIAADARAVETMHAYGDLRLGVQVVGDASLAAEVDAMKATVGESSLLKLVDSDATAAARCYLIGPRSAAAASDPVPQLGAVAAPTWAVVRADGELAMPPKSLAQRHEVLRNLEVMARHRQALALDNPDPASALRGKFELQLLRQSADGSWTIAEPDAASGEIVFEEGEKIDIKVTSNHDAHAYVTILDFGLTGAIQLVYPARGAREQLMGGLSFTIGKGRGIPLEFPKVFELGADAAGSGPQDGVESVKLIVTTREADFSFLQQAGVRAAAVATPSPLMSLWRTALGHASREMALEPVEDEDWTTVVRSFVLRRKRPVTPVAT